jgi:hypothetical protein
MQAKICGKNIFLSAVNFVHFAKKIKGKERHDQATLCMKAYACKISA